MMITWLGIGMVVRVCVFLIILQIFQITIVSGHSHSHSHSDESDHVTATTDEPPESEVPQPPNVNLNPHEKLIVLSFDGFRYDYLDKVDTPNLKKLQAHGVSTKYMNPVFPTKTFVNHQSFVTGLYAESHGVVDNRFYDPKYVEYLEGFVSYNDKLWNYDENVVPIWILNEWAGDGRRSGVAFPGANQPYGANRTLPHHYNVYNVSLPHEERIDIAYSWLTHETHPANLVFMYFEQPDLTGHKFGPESEEVREAIAKMDNITKYLVDKLIDAGIFDQVNLMIWSDHGMEEISLENRINLSELVNMRGAYKWYGGSPVLQIRPVEGRKVDVYDALKHASVNRPFSVYKRSDIPERWHYSQCRRIMDILVIADLGFVFEDFQYGEIDTSKKFGLHGYDNQFQNMKPIFIAHGPRFKRGYEAEPFTNIDLFPLIAQLMGFDPPPNNGSLSNVVGMLASSGKSKSNMAASWNWLIFYGIVMYLIRFQVIN